MILGVGASGSRPDIKKIGGASTPVKEGEQRAWSIARNLPGEQSVRACPRKRCCLEGYRGGTGNKDIDAKRKNSLTRNEKEEGREEEEHGFRPKQVCAKGERRVSTRCMTGKATKRRVRSKSEKKASRSTFKGSRTLRKKNLVRHPT